MNREIYILNPVDSPTRIGYAVKNSRFQHHFDIVTRYDANLEFRELSLKYRNLVRDRIDNRDDEVQSGIGRCGHFFAVQAHAVEPDIITSAKALGGGIPCGAILCTNEIAARFGPGDLGTTFGGGPVASAAIVAVSARTESKTLPGIFSE